MEHASEEELATLAELVGSARVALLTTTTATGQLVSRPLAVQDRPFDGELWFFTQHPSSKTDDILASPQVNVALESGKGWVSISGTASVVQDREKADELWNPAASAWFPDGREDPSVALIRVHADSAEYWAHNDPKVVALFKLARAAVTGGQPDVGENRAFGL
jgi:general stress protein 26